MSKHSDKQIRYQRIHDKDKVLYCVCTDKDGVAFSEMIVPDSIASQGRIRHLIELLQIGDLVSLIFKRGVCYTKERDLDGYTNHELITYWILEQSGDLDTSDYPLYQSKNGDSLFYADRLPADYWGNYIYDAYYYTPSDSVSGDDDW
jgi:hypothetical protein